MNDDWYGPDAATFGDRVAAAREAAGMTQEDLARRLGIKIRTMRNWEDDVAEPRANKLTMMAGMLNVSVMWLLTGDGDGVAAPEEEVHVAAPDLSGILAEMRDLRAQMRGNIERLGRLEKRLRGLGTGGQP